MTGALVKSTVLHAAALLLAWFGVPSLFEDPPLAPTVVTVAMVPVAPERNLPPEPVAETPPPEPAAVPDSPRPSNKPPAPAREAAVVPVPTRLLDQTARPKRKPPPPRAAPRALAEETPPAPDPLDFEQALEQLAENAPPPAADPSPPAADPLERLLARADTPFRLDARLSMAEIDAIRSQIQRNWSVPAGAEDAHEMTVTLHLQLAPDGTVYHVEVVERARMRRDSFFRTMAESAVRAVQLTGRIRGLSSDSYQKWRDINIRFNPRDMFR